MQSLMTKGPYNFAGGATGVYISTDTAANYFFSNNGNDSIGPTRGFTKDSIYVYTCTSQGVFRSDDSGITWLSKSNGIANLFSSGITYVYPYLFVVTPTGVFRSDDHGDNWTPAGLSSIDVRCITAIQDTLFAGTNGLGIYKSVDFGVYWTPVNNGLTSTNIRAIESKGNTLFAGGQIGTGVFRSTDFGANWSLLSGGLPTGSYRGFTSNSQLIVAGSFGSGVFYSIDNGDNWTKINTGLTDSTIYDLELNDSYIIAATNTQGVFRYALSDINIPSGLKDPEPGHDIIIYPNPSWNILQVRINKKYLDSKYSIADISGKNVMNGKLIGEITTIELQDLPAGIYSFRLNENIREAITFVRK